MADRQLVNDLHAKMRLPIITAPMFLISGPDLLIAAAKAGIVGCMPLPNARTLDDLAGWLAKIDSETKAAGKDNMWAANMIVHKSYDRFDAEMDLLEQYRPKFVVTALGSPKRAVERVHNFGGQVIADVINAEQAKKAVDAGADGLVLVCSGAGGHTGHYSPFSFVEEVRRFFDGPLIVGGAMQSARSVAALLTLGADFAYMGTRFISCPESLVNDDYRDMLVRATMADIVTSDAVSGVKANWLKESLEKAGIDFEKLEGNTKIDFSDIQGDNKAWKNIWGAGHGVGSTQKVCTVQEVVDDIAAQFDTLKSEVSTHLNNWPKA